MEISLKLYKNLLQVPAGWLAAMPFDGQMARHYDRVSTFQTLSRKHPSLPLDIFPVVLREIVKQRFRL